MVVGDSALLRRGWACPARLVANRAGGLKREPR
jgi:hypothetical protein